LQREVTQPSETQGGSISSSGRPSVHDPTMLAGLMEEDIRLWLSCVNNFVQARINRQENAQDRSIVLRCLCLAVVDWIRRENSKHQVLISLMIYLWIVVLRDAAVLHSREGTITAGSASTDEIDWRIQQ